MGEQNTQALVRHNGESGGVIDHLRTGGPGFALTFADMRERVEGLNEFYRGVMQEGTDYGRIPGTDKPTLLQPGAQLLDGIFGLSPTFEEMPSCVRDYELGFFSFDMRCRLIEKRTGQVVAEGVGHCNSKEDRYRWRSAKRRCPACSAEAIIKGKAEYGGGWVCFKKQGGCGATYRDDDHAIVDQPAGRVENDDPYSLVNTVLKMAQKRAHVAATLNATGASRIFTQDVEDLPEFQRTPAVAEVVDRDPPVRVKAPPEAPKAMLDAARDLFRQARAAGIPVEPPAAKDQSTLVTWSADVRHRLEIQRGASAESGDRDDVEIELGEAAETVAADDFDAVVPPQTQAQSSPPWADTPLGKQVSALVDALTEAKARFQLPPNNATEADLEGWLSSKKGLLRARGGRVPS